MSKDLLMTDVTLRKIRGPKSSYFVDSATAYQGRLFHFPEVGGHLIVAKNHRDRYVTSKVIRVFGSSDSTFYVQTRNSLYLLSVGARITQPEHPTENTGELRAAAGRRRSPTVS